MQLARGLDAGEDARHGLTTYAGRGRRRKVRELKDLVDVAKTAAARGAGAWQGERRLRVSGLTEARHALVGTGFPFKDLPRLRRYLDQFAAVMGATSGIRRAGSAALDLVDVAAGRLDAFWELTLAPWDIAAGVVLIREASGVVTTLTGEDDVLRHGSLVAGSPTMHRWLLDLLKSA